MALFRPYERTAKESADRIAKLTPQTKKEPAKESDKQVADAATMESATAEPIKVKAPRKKESPTPKRKEAEAARMERLHPSLSPKEQRRAEARARSKARWETWEKIEQSPERRLLRNFVDTRWTLAEFMMPAMILIMAGMMIAMQFQQLALSTAIGLTLWVLMALTFIEFAFMWRSFKKLLAQRYPEASRRGLLMYMINRALMIRRFRQPGPVVERSESI